VQLYAFDILALDGEDLRCLPLSLRKTNLARLLARRPDGSFGGAYVEFVRKICPLCQAVPSEAAVMIECSI
jgi:ATP-dependent DNA ligase